MAVSGSPERKPQRKTERISTTHQIDSHSVTHSKSITHRLGKNEWDIAKGFVIYSFVFFLIYKPTWDSLRMVE